MDSGVTLRTEDHAILTDVEIYPSGVARDAVVQTILRKSLPDVSDGSRRFIPRGALLETLNFQQVSRLVGLFYCGANDSMQEELVTYICPGGSRCSRCGRVCCTGGRIIFATLIWIARQDLLPFSLETRPDMCDSHLPLLDTQIESTRKNETEVNWVNDVFERMSPVEAELFGQVQLQLSAPFLRLLGPQDTTEFTFKDTVTLPWIGYDAVRIPLPGNPCEVAKVHIHPDHHALGDGDVNLFAIKIFQSGYRRLGLQEFRAEFLANQETPKHDRFTPLLTAFRHKTRLHLVFPWAHEGDLKLFWQNHTMSGQHSIEWVMGECLGIADGLATLHGFAASRDDTGHGAVAPPLAAAWLHADIKPTNILCFYDQGQETLILKLADFGFSRQLGPDATLASNTLQHTKTYRAPEQDIEQAVTLKSDVWSLGCVILEFITWSLVGWLEIERFSDRRLDEHDNPKATHAIGTNYEDTFFTKQVKKHLWFGRFGLQVDTAIDALPLEKDARYLTGRVYSLRLKKRIQVGCRVKDAVIEQIGVLSNHKDCTNRLRRFLAFVRDRMLVVDVEKRADSKEVRDFLTDKVGGGFQPGYCR